MLESLHHTWTGGMLVIAFFVSCWVLAPAYVAMLLAGMASESYGLSFLFFAMMGIEKKTHRQVWFVVCTTVSLYFMPRSFWAPGAWRYYICFLQTTASGVIMYFLGPLPKQPAFVKKLQDLDPCKYHVNGCELVGALDDIKTEGSMMCFHPHGILSVGFSLNACWNKRFREISPNTRFMIDKALREDVIFFKLLCDANGHVDTLNKKNLLKHMANKTNVAFIPGGFEDATAAEFGVERTVMKKRTGFIKYALQNGVRVHPIYSFGESKTYYTMKSFLDFRMWLNKFGIPAVIMFGFPFCPLLPRPEAQIMTVVGKAIEFPKIETPTSEDVTKWHKTYMDALDKLFEDNKKAAGLPASKKLEVW
mmetsp:Transcript_30543/g.65797  ORF Transcript_30543/g.65797 Transcript_30543/m.65797 type:complete len:363 (-) Transcript_30543:199-1287(-)|eukprot:CAMPEP_0206464814 /NCGR_PEP_ID=MMETSP0324_2-20121206/27442_1 /ASSEMBLY_ACC=CAM_ASM_000836 /TAXON_ID=2866 /ORGANISM="Crypthecodinium cohnii, Strain Seligo" /LENGTH=362 /DNA_ID=CAMNT_0053937521 /DNA_START=44 /DNA_END=1132 /DNA_ORIENTATION=+